MTSKTTTAKPAAKTAKVTVIPPTSKRVKDMDKAKAAAAAKPAVAKASNAKAAPKAAAPKVRKDSTGKANAAACGFPAVYVNATTGRFIPGMDARAKSDLRAAISGKATGRELATFTKAAARKLAATRGWDIA